MSTYRRVDDNRAPEAYDNCPDFLEKYLNYLSVFENKKPGSVMETCISLREFFQFTHYCNVIHEKPSTSDAHKDMDITQMQLSEICQVTEPDIEVYLCFLDTVTHNVMSTICKKLSYIRSFYSYLERNAPELGICLSEGNPALRIPNPKPAKADAMRILSIEQINKLVSSTTGSCAKRDSCIILLMATTGLTISEVCNLNRADLDRGKNTLRVREPNGASRTAYVTPACADLLSGYLTELDAANADEPIPAALFISSQKSKRLTPRAIQKRITITAAAANMANLNITAQDLRNTAVATILGNSTLQQQQRILKSLGFRTNKHAARFLSALPCANSDIDALQQIVNNSPLSQIG